MVLLVTVCACLWVAATSIAAASGSGAATGAGDTLVSWPLDALAATAGPPVEAHLRITSVDPANLLAGLNVTLSRRHADRYAAAAAADAAAAAGAPGSTLELAFGGVSRALPWPPPQQGEHHAHSRHLSARLRELVPGALGAYSLALRPLSAVLRQCGGGGGGGGEGGSPGGGGGAAAAAAARGEAAPRTLARCSRVALPVLLLLDGSGVPGYRLRLRPGNSAGGGGGGGPHEELVITSATRQRVLRLMSVMLQWLAAAYLSAWWAGELLTRWLLRRLLSRRGHMIMLR